MHRSIRKFADKPLDSETINTIIASGQAAATSNNIQATIVIQVTDESLGMGICYIGGLRNNPAGVSELLNLPENDYPVFVLCIGYPEQDPEI